MTNINTIEKLVIWFAALFVFLGTYFFKLGPENGDMITAYLNIIKAKLELVYPGNIEIITIE